MQDGIYKIYRLRFDESDQEHRRLVGRMHVDAGQIAHLEDHGNLDELFPEGPVTELVERRMKQLQNSGYYEIVHEADAAQGAHPQDLEQVDLGHVEADHKFIMTGDGMAHPSMVELWDDAVVVDGRRLDDTEAHQMLGEVAAGRLILTPLD